MGNRFYFQGREYLAGIGIYDFRNRAYSPSLGRFLQMDPARSGDKNNFYQFAGNNPVTGRDPTGLIPGYLPPTGFGGPSFITGIDVGWGSLGDPSVINWDSGGGYGSSGGDTSDGSADSNGWISGNAQVNWVDNPEGIPPADPADNGSPGTPTNPIPLDHNKKGSQQKGVSHNKQQKGVSQQILTDCFICRKRCSCQDSLALSILVRFTM